MKIIIFITIFMFTLTASADQSITLDHGEVLMAFSNDYSCPAGYVSGFTIKAENNPKLKITTGSSISLGNSQKVTLEVTCQPIYCEYQKIGLFHRDYQVVYFNKDGERVIAAENIATEEEAISFAQGLIEEGVCAKIDKITFWDVAYL